jgi:transposase
MSRRYQNIRWLQRWYVDYDSTQTELADRCGVSTKTISNWVEKFDIKKNRHDPDWLTDKYVRERLSQRQIGELCDTGSSTIGDQLRKHGIQRDRNYSRN